MGSRAGSGGMMTPVCPRYAGYRFPAEVISHVVWLYFSFLRSLSMVEEILAARGIIVGRETVRQWPLKSGPNFSGRSGRARGTATPLVVRCASNSARCRATTQIHNLAILGAIAVADVDHHPRAVDIGAARAFVQEGSAAAHRATMAGCSRRTTGGRRHFSNCSLSSVAVVQRFTFQQCGILFAQDNYSIPYVDLAYVSMH